MFRSVSLSFANGVSQVSQIRVSQFYVCFARFARFRKYEFSQAFANTSFARFRNYVFRFANFRKFRKVFAMGSLLMSPCLQSRICPGCPDVKRGTHIAQTGKRPIRQKHIPEMTKQAEPVCLAARASQNSSLNQWSNQIQATRFHIQNRYKDIINSNINV